MAGLSPLVSIVIPAYNAAKRLEATLLSIAAQDYKHIEIIVVDDASSDSTGALAENVLSEVKVIRHDRNMGVSAARNTGLKAAAGDYVIFFDADDLADTNFVSVLLKTISERDSDMAFCGYRDRYPDGDRPVPVGLDPARRYGELALMYMFQKIGTAVWAAIFKTSFLRAAGLEFTEGCAFGEDTEFLTKALCRSGSVNFSAGCHYIYVHHEDMASNAMRRTPEKILRRHEHSAGAVCRAARYAAEHALSPKVRAAAMNFLLPEGLIKSMNAAARRGDKRKFYGILRAAETRRALWACLRHIVRKPELAFKAAALLAVPSLYFRVRSKI